MTTQTSNFARTLVQNYLDGKIASSADLLSFITAHSTVCEQQASYKADKEQQTEKEEVAV